MSMNLFKIYANAGRDECICTSMTEMDTPEEALEEVRGVAGVECFLESTAWAERVKEA